MFATDPDTLYASTHQAPLFPGTGKQGERGVCGNIVNAPLPTGAGTMKFRNAMRHRVLPALSAFRAELLMISAGFDAHVADPLADMRLDADDFYWATQELLAVASAEPACRGRVVSVLEGGYNHVLLLPHAQSVTWRP